MMAIIRMIRFTAKNADIEIFVPLKPNFSPVRYLNKIPLEQKHTGVRMPKSTGTHTGSSSPLFRICGASLYTN